MDFRKLGYVMAIAKYKNITKAAEALYVGQPTLSKFLISLEEELGLKLFRRLGNRYELTYAGERYAAKAAEILRLRDELDAEMNDIRKNDRGVLNIAFAKMRCSYMLPATLPFFQEQYPNVQVNIVDGNSSDNDRKLLEGQIEIAFYSKPAELNPMIEYRTLAREELLICTSRDHPLKKYAIRDPGSPYPALELSRLEDERVLMMSREQRTRQIVDGLLDERGVKLNNPMPVTNIPAIIGLAASGYGVSFAFETHLNHYPDKDAIERYSIAGGRVIGDFVAATRRGSYLSKYAEAFIEIVRREANNKQ